MKPIYAPLPTNESNCFPTTTENVIQCYSNNNTVRNTYRLLLDSNGIYWLRTSSDNNYNYQSYNPTGAVIDGSKGYPIFPELTHFWFPLISCVCVACIFFFIYKILFKRFVK